MDAITMAVLSSKLDGIVREMSNTLLRAGRSTVLTTARDFSCAIVTSDDDLLATAEGLPVHVVGAAHQAATMREMHPEFSEGDAYLHNDPYNGNTHAADHTILVPVFVAGEHMFTAFAKAHQADAGNSVPTTYAPFARDVYEEGAIIFPCVLVQQNYADVEDIIRMCQARIRVPDQWYGDYLALIGAARIGERRLQELVEQYGKSTVREFISEWFEYSERRMIAGIREFESASFEFEGRHDPIPAMPEGIPIQVRCHVDREEALITVDLRDNIDCIAAGLNLSRVCSINNATAGVYNCLDPTIPHNQGSLRRIKVAVRENCIVGIPRFPASCSLATTNVGDRLVSVTQCAFASRYEKHGLAEGAGGLGPGFGVISGRDTRRDDEPFISQIFLGCQGGPGTPETDGWLVFSNPAAAGLLHRDSVELDEQRYPLHVKEIVLIRDSEGAGRHRGAPGARAVFGPAKDSLNIAYTVDHHFNPPAGVQGGGPGGRSDVYVLDSAGRRRDVELVGQTQLTRGDFIVSTHSGGGGYGPPHERSEESVMKDVTDGLVSVKRARDVYGIAVEEVAHKSGRRKLVIDEEETSRLRQILREEGHVDLESGGYRAEAVIPRE